jgi:small GTP-binding protein
MIPLVAIVGRPNVGKSTLFNRLVGKSLAIVKDEPGVTRDRHYADAHLQGRDLLLVDTGGFDPEAVDRLDQGVFRHVQAAIREADVVVCVLDGRGTPTGADEANIALLRKSEKPTIYVANRVDNPEQALASGDLYRLGLDNLFPISALHGRGMAEFEAALVDALPVKTVDEARDLTRLPKIALIGRPNAGKIYTPDKVQWALENFFQAEKLAVLREIALREVAESVDRTVSAKAGNNDAERRAAASERVMVCLPSRPPPHGAMLLRQGSRLAGRLNTDWFVVHVETKAEANHRIDATLQRHLLEDEQRARDLGAEVVRLRSDRPVDALLEFGRDHGVRHIVVGRSHKPWWRRLLGQSPVFKLVTEAVGFDLHIVSLEDREAKE